MGQDGGGHRGGKPGVSGPPPQSLIGASLPVLSAAAGDCRACPLWRGATQTVFGEGLSHAPLMFVGEQPGDEEDLAGRPFVGPAGRLLGRVLDEIGVDRRTSYLTNAVKHFKWIPSSRGKRRLHQKPSPAEVAACRPWLLAEIEAVAPEVVVCLGATAAQALLGRDFRVTRRRGVPLAVQLALPPPRDPLAIRVVATVHPSSILRAPDPTIRATELARFITDLQAAAALVAASHAAYAPDSGLGG